MEKMSFSQILKSEEACETFRQFLKKEICDENLEFWIEVELHKQQSKLAIIDEIKDRNYQIYRKYLTDGAERQIYCEQDKFFELKKKLFRPDSAADPDLFNDIHEDIYNLMETNLYFKFRRTLLKNSFLDQQERMSPDQESSNDEEEEVFSPERKHKPHSPHSPRHTPRRNTFPLSRLCKSLILKRKKSNISHSSSGILYGEYYDIISQRSE